MTQGRHAVLILGAGLVSRPIVRYFLDDPECRLTVASLAVEDAKALLDRHPGGTAHAVDVSDPSQLDPLIRQADLVVSLVPFAYHVAVARCAIRNHVNTITASYVFPEMRALDGEARQAGVTILNELGLDPGLDHMSAMRMIDELRSTGGSVVEFVSCCGGLPAPEAADNPWGYKFSWSPRGALLAGKLSARHLQDGRVVNVPGDELFGHARPFDIEGLGRFEIYPNRDSLRYIGAYDIPNVETMLRATLRHPGWSETMNAVAHLGLLAVQTRSWPPGTRYVDFLASFLPSGPGALRVRLAERLGVAPDHPIVERFAWAGLLSEDEIGPRNASPLSVLANRFAERMRYEPGQRDMVVLRHEILARWPDGHQERRTSMLVEYGEPGGDSATARTVSLPAAVAGKLLLDGTVQIPGVHIPTGRQIYEPVLDGLERRGIAFRESAEPARDV